MTTITSDPESSLRLQARVLERIAARHPLSEILAGLCLLVEELFPEAICSVMVPSSDGTLKIGSAPSISDEGAACLNGLVPGDLAGSCGTAFHTRQPVIVEDTATDPRWVSLRDIAQQLNIRACWSLPILAHHGSPLGTFAISHLVKRQASQADIELLKTAGHLAGIAMERDLAETERREKATLLDAVIDGSTDYICSKDMAGRYLLANNAVCGLFGRPASEIVGRTDEEILPSGVAASFADRDREVHQAGRGISYSHEFKIAGVARTVHTHKYPLWNDHGEMKGVIAIARDVTDQRRAEEALRQSQKLESLGVLAGGIAHDFNNLLTGILSNADLLVQDVLPEHEMAGALSDIQSAASRARELTRQMLVYAGKGHSEREIVDVEELVREVGHLIGSSISKDARVSYDFPCDLPSVHANATQLRQVVMNLLTNASDALYAGMGQVRISGVAHSGDEQRLQGCLVGVPDPATTYVEIVVEDDGAGIEDATRARMFDPFFTTKPTGRGLGLATLLGTIHGHDGLVDVVTTPGAGTSFHVFLPAEAQRHATTAVGAGEQTHAYSASNTAVLIIDDEEIVRSFVSRALRGRVAEATCASSGEEGLEILRANPDRFDVVLLDITMPGLSGLQVFRELRRTRPTLPVILTSGLHRDDALAGFLPDEFTAFIAKPFVRDQLIRAIDDALHSSGPGARPS